MPRGGRRPGAGRKPWKNAGLVEGGKSTADSKPPADLNGDVEAVWKRLAPLAQANGTLVPATEYAFKELCRWVVHMEQAWALVVAGKEVNMSLMLTLATKLDGKLHDFLLAPMGKPIKSDKDKPKSALDRLKEQRQNLHAIK